jgi:UDP-N-acetylmuramoyl-L-alanyl-D-glutamate--2,6-diaminopimelate ligase
LAQNLYFAGQPQPFLLGVTGTSGKTTTAFLAAQLLDGWQGRCAYLGTVGHGFVGSLAPSSMTTPDVLTLHRQLAELAVAGARRVVCEVSSHALDQGRLDGLEINVAAFTNLGRDHLDYHGDMQSYAAAKARLFARPELKAAVVNGHDPRAALMLQQAPSPCQKWLCFMETAEGQPQGHGRTEASIRLEARCLQEAPALRLALAGSLGKATVETGRLWGSCNAENLLLAMGMALAAGRSLAEVLDVARQVHLPPGRFETFVRADGLIVVVDYAHKPEALEAALRACRSRTRGRLICVFGCGGNRDQGKRVLMGAVAAACADAVWITDDNPRNEDPALITAAIEAGLRGTGVPYGVCHDRGQAIIRAIAEAEPGDVVLVAGKGHETSQEQHGSHRAFDDRAVVRACLAAEGAWA